MMNLDWVETRGGDGEIIRLNASTDVAAESQLQSSVDSALESAVQLLDKIARDESRYFICEWQFASSTLTITVTDQSKTIDSSPSLDLALPAMAGKTESEAEEMIEFWITDYLSTCSAFLKFSLIALFHTGDRSRGRLL